MNYEKLFIQAKLFVYVGAHLGAANLVELPISSIRANFEENGIPFCTVGVATGRNSELPDSILGLSPFHINEQQMRLPTRAAVRLKVTRQDLSGPTNQYWPDDWFTAFEGWVSDSIPEVTLGSRSVTVRLTHWCSDLDFSSPFSEDVFPTTPSDFLFNATTVHGTGLQRTIVGSTTMSKALSSFTTYTITTDTWDDSNGGGIRQFFYATANERLFNWQQIANFTGIAASNFPRTNNLMTFALSRFEPFYDDEIGIDLYQYGCPLRLRNDISASGQLALKIQKEMTEAVYGGNTIGTTIWDKLVAGIAPQFMFSVIPMVDRVLTVPYTPWLNQTWTRIASDEFDMLSYSSTVRRPVRAVAVIGGYASSTGLRSNQQAAGSVIGNRKVLGYYEPTPSNINATREGMTRYVGAPAWINDLFMQGFSSLTAPLTGNIPLASNPRTRALDVPPPGFIGPLLPDQIQAQMEAKQVACESLANALAKATYLQDSTQMRQAVISTNLRFDIAPGSTILIQSSPDPFVEAMLNSEGQTDTDLVGRVVRVTWSLDISGQGASSSTVFHVAYLRTLAENNDEAFASDDHPLWRDVWRGAPLIALPQFSQ